MKTKIFFQLNLLVLFLTLAFSSVSAIAQEKGDSIIERLKLESTKPIEYSVKSEILPTHSKLLEDVGVSKSLPDSSSIKFTFPLGNPASLNFEYYKSEKIEGGKRYWMILTSKEKLLFNEDSLNKEEVLIRLDTFSIQDLTEEGIVDLNKSTLLHLYFESKKSIIKSIPEEKVDQNHWPKRLHYRYILYSERTSENEPVIKSKLFYTGTTSGLVGVIFILVLYVLILLLSISYWKSEVTSYHGSLFTFWSIAKFFPAVLMYIFCGAGILLQGILSNSLAPDKIGAFIAGGMIILFWIILFITYKFYFRPLDKKYLENLNSK